MSALFPWPWAAVSPELMALSGSALLGLAVGGVTWALMDLLSRPRRERGELGVFEHQRRTRLREGSLVYRWFEPFIDALAPGRAGGPPERLVRLKRDLSLAGDPLPWVPEEYLATKLIESGFVALS